MPNEETPPAPVSAEKLREWRRLADAASPAPWIADTADPSDVVVWGGDGDLIGNVGNDAIVPVPQDEADAERLRVIFDMEPKDAAFIAAARTALPRLVAEVERLRARLKDIGDFQGKTLIGSGRYDEGANAAFEQCARLARAALRGEDGASG